MTQEFRVATVARVAVREVGSEEAPSYVVVHLLEDGSKKQASKLVRVVAVVSSVPGKDVAPVKAVEQAEEAGSAMQLDIVATDAVVAARLDGRLDEEL